MFIGGREGWAIQSAVGEEAEVPFMWLAALGNRTGTSSCSITAGGNDSSICASSAQPARRALRTIS